jgi:hypothetical protein
MLVAGGAAMSWPKLETIEMGQLSWNQEFGNYKELEEE